MERNQMSHGATIGIVAIVVVLLVLVSPKSHNPSATPTPTPTATATVAADELPDWRRVVRAKSQVRSALRDGSSAEFSGEYVSRKSGVPNVCGFVNANNGFGGKAGRQAYISGAVTVIEEQVTADEMKTLWDKIC